MENSLIRPQRGHILTADFKREPDEAIRHFISVTPLLQILPVLQASVGVSFAASSSGVTTQPLEAAAITAVLTTGGNMPIMVNGTPATSGATILSGDTIETPDQVAGMISIPGRGRLEIAPNAKLTLAFDRVGNLKVNLLKGCIVMSTKKGTAGEVYDSRRTLGVTDAVKDDALNVCPDPEPSSPQSSGNNWNDKDTAVVVIGGIGTGLILYL